MKSKESKGNAKPLRAGGSLGNSLLFCPGSSLMTDHPSGTGLHHVVYSLPSYIERKGVREGIKRGVEGASKHAGGFVSVYILARVHQLLESFRAR